MVNHPPKATVILLPLKTWLGIDYRSVSACLRAFLEQRIKIGLENPPPTQPSATTSSAYQKLNTQLTKLHQKGGLRLGVSAEPGLRYGSEESIGEHGRVDPAFFRGPEDLERDSGLTSND